MGWVMKIGFCHGGLSKNDGVVSCDIAMSFFGFLRRVGSRTFV